MKILIKITIVCVLLFPFSSCQDNIGLNCSTFMLKTDNALFVGHNLDEDPGLHVPGAVCINKRGIYREGITWYELIADPSDFEKVLLPYENKPEPKVSWIAKYGSVTFNSEGIDFPDGGINEKGLSVFEMSLGNTQFAIDTTKPTLFITLWIQYQLDNFATVDEVIKNIHIINQQGWSWHYFVSDKSGCVAIIEYLNGEVVIHKNEDVRYPVLCNSSYERELERLTDYEGFAGELRSFFFSSPRFVQAAEMLNEYNPSEHQSPKEYALKILDEIKISGWNKWGILIDVNNMTVYFHTNRNPDLMYFTFRDFEFSDGTPCKMLNVHEIGLSGSVSANFKDYSYEKNLKLTMERAEQLFEKRFTGLIDNGVTAEVYAKRFANYSEQMRTKMD